MKKAAIKLLGLVSIFGLLTGCQLSATQQQNGTPSQRLSFQDQLTWKEVRPGLSYATLTIKTDNPKEPKNLIIARIDPKKYAFTIYQNTTQEKAKTIKEIHSAANSLLTFNGGLFTEDFTPTGLLISGGKILHPASNAKLLNGIFTINKNGDAEVTGKTDPETGDYAFAIQSGPLLIDKLGRIAISDKSEDSASRTAIGLDKDGKIVLIVLKQSLLNIDNEITLYQFAGMLKESQQLKELGIHSVLNLDGGTSSGLMIGNQYYAEMVKVQNVIIVKPKTNA